MTRDDDRILVDGDMSVNTTYGSSTMTAGTICVRGNLTNRNPYGFHASGTHEVILDPKQSEIGFDIQNVSFAKGDPEVTASVSGLNRLVLTGPRSAYRFTPEAEKIAAVVEEQYEEGELLPVTHLTGQSITAKSVTITFDDPNVGVTVTGYRIIRDGELLAVTGRHSFTDQGLTPGTTYHYSVAPLDKAGHYNAVSEELSVTTLQDTEGPTVPEKQPGHYEFKPKVCSGYMKDLFGETMCETWYNLVDAVLAGEDTFECPDYETYRWVMGQFPERLFPVLVDVLDYPLPEETAVIDGIAHFNYKYDHEQVLKRISDFENMIVEILNESMEDDYSDFEKVIALYNYFAHHYTYDYDLYERKQAGEFVELSSINFLDKGTGICQEISTAYSYILLQAGVEATTMSGIRGYDNMSHAWSYVKINGNEYHIDPTFVLDDNTLSYLMMNDDRRSNYDDFDRSTYRITSNYSQDHPVPEFVADDDKFSPIWNTKFEAIDTEKDILYCKYKCSH